MGSGRRRSLQSLLIPGFLRAVEPGEVKPRPQSTQFHTWGYSARRNSPPLDFLLDEDPFAKFEPPAPKKPKIPAPRSPRSAFQKPAFPSRPSLPSLASLARMNVVVSPRIPNGRIGAQLPPEPWLEVNSDTLPSTPSESLDFSSADERDSRTSSSSERSWSSSCESLVDDSAFGRVNVVGDSLTHSELQEILGSDQTLRLDSTSHTADLPWHAPWLYSDTDAEQTFEQQPGTSATVRASIVPGDGRSSLQTMWNQPADASDWSRNGRQSTDVRWSQSNGNSGGWSYSRNGNNYSNGRNSGDGNNAGDGGRDPRKPHSGPSFPLVSSSETSSDEEEEEEDSGDDLGPVLNRPKASASSDDDVPLARSIPTALKAQRTIRIRAREEREQRRKERAEREARGERPRQTTLRPNGAGPSSQGSGSALHPTQQPQRQRAHTLAQSAKPFAFDELDRKLQDVQTGTQRRRGNTYEERIPTSVPSASPHPPLREPPPSLRPMRSFHQERSNEPGPEADSLSRTKSRTSNDSFARSASRPPPALPLPPESDLTPDLERKPTKLVKERPRPSLPQMSAHISKSSFSQQRVFVGDMQTFHMVEINTTTTAGDVVKMVEDQGGFKGWVGTGGWMVWEVAQDFGMERPVRSFELLSDVEASWNKDKTVNTFILKLTTLEPLLNPSAIPTSSPVASGYVEWEMKRGKWTKRWLVLRQHSLYLAKRDNGKDETFLCSLSNFDFYKVTRPVKAPKPFVFSIKSTDNLSYFENTADYLHNFSCSERDAAKWTEKILVARSYVLIKERNILSKPSTAPPIASVSRAPTRKSTTSARSASKQQTLLSINPDEVFEPGTPSASVSRAPTRKSTTSARSASKQQTLLNINPDEVFEPGTLLGK